MPLDLPEPLDWGTLPEGTLPEGCEDGPELIDPDGTLLDGGPLLDETLLLDGRLLLDPSPDPALDWTVLDGPDTLLLMPGGEDESEDGREDDDEVGAVLHLP